jgi:hypothetical protein
MIILYVLNQIKANYYPTTLLNRWEHLANMIPVRGYAAKQVKGPLAPYCLKEDSLVIMTL